MQEKSFPGNHFREVLFMSSYIRTSWSNQFFQSPNCIFDVEDLSAHEKLCYLYLCRCADGDMKSFPSYNTIGDKMSANRRTAMRSVKSLEEKGYLVVERRKESRKKNLSNIYILIHPNEVIHSGDRESPKECSVVTQSHQGSDTESPNKYPIKNTQNKKDIYTDIGHADKKEFHFYNWLDKQ